MPIELDQVFKRRRYLHFDAPLSRKKLQPLVTDATAVANRRFLPLLLTEIDRSKVRRDPISRRREVVKRVRPLSACSHADAALYAYYASILDPLYEARLVELGLSDNVTAFRQLGKSNIEFAHEAFVWIDEHRPCVALAFDVKDFFGSLSHAYLKKRWAETIGMEPLPADHFHVFRSLTKFTWVRKFECFKVLGISENNPRSGGRKRLCATDDFRKKISPLIHKNNEGAGIPQGTPISALLSNIYMLDFDAAVDVVVRAAGGLYRRYCDDILCVVPPESEHAVLSTVQNLAKQLKLTLHPEKTTRHLFAGVIGLAVSGTPLQYLGLTFDGEFVRLRTAGIGRYYNKMRSAVRAARSARNKVAKLSDKPNSEMKIYTRELLERFSHVGSRNFITYAHRAAKATGSAAIRKQVKRHDKELRANIARKQNSK